MVGMHGGVDGICQGDIVGVDCRRLRKAMSGEGQGEQRGCEKQGTGHQGIQSELLSDGPVMPVTGGLDAVSAGTLPVF